MSTLPTDIIVDILARLPPKPLCRFKSVAKFWNTLISSDAFIKLHLTQTRNNSNPNLIICYDSLSSATISVPNSTNFSFSAVDHPVNHLTEFATVQFIGSCDGILCISDRFKKTVFMYNPSTNMSRLVPPPPSRIPEGDHPLETHFNPFVYKPIDHIVVFGFGYDSSVDDYKLLRVIECYEDRVRVCREVRLFKLRTNSWTNVDDKIDYYPNQQMDGVHINGVLYFAVSDEGGVPKVKCFDFRTEEFSVFDMFEYDTSFDKFSFVLVELGGCFGVMANYLKHDLCMHFGWRLACAELWVMKGSCWVMLFRVNNPSRMGSLTHIRPVVYSKDGGMILLELDGSKFCWFDWGRDEFKRVKASGLPSRDLPFDTYTYVPSIVSLRTDEDRVKDIGKAKGKVMPKKNIHKKKSDGFLSTGFKLRL